MDRQKELYQKALSLIKQEKYKEAYDEYLDVLLLKDQKNIEYNMLSGLCFQKLKNFKKAEEFYLYTLEKRPEDPKILNALFKLNKDDIKNKEKAIEYGQKLITIYKKTDIGKAMDATVGYCEILHENQERKILDVHFLELLKHGTAEQVYKVAKFYIPLIIDLKLIDVTQPKSFNSIILQFSQKIYNQLPNFEIIEIIARKVVSKFPLDFRDIIFGLAIQKEHYVVLFDWLELLPSSCFLLDQVLRYCHCFLDYKIKFLLEQCIILLSDANEGLTYMNYQIYDEEQFNKTTLKAQAFLAFMRIYASQIVQQCGDQFLSVIDKLLQQKNFDIIEKEKDYTILELPLKVAQLFKSGNKENSQMANTLMVDFNKRMKQLKNFDFDVSVLEEVGANLGYDILADPVELMEMKNLLKIRIKNKAYSLETYEKYFDYQIKLVSLIRHYDEELSMQLIFEKILSDDPQNLKVQINYDWLKFSENKISQTQLVEIYQKYLPAPPKIEQIIFKRIGTIKLINNQINEAKSCFEKVQGDDYEASLALGMIAFYQKQYSESLEHLYRAFNYCQTNYHLNQIIMFVLNKLKQKDKALEFAINIYKLQQFQNVYWLSFTIGQHLMQKVQFGKAHDILQKAADQFHFNVEKTYKLYYEKKFDQGDFSIPYFINQNDNLYLSDYPVFSSNYLVNQGMIVLTEQYFQDEKYLKLFKLEMKLAELKKILGLQGSALKSLEKAEELLLNENNNQISDLDNYLTMKCDITTNKGKLIRFTQELNQIQIQNRWVCTLKTKKIDKQYSKLLILHNFECAQLQLYGQQEYFSQERMIQGLLMSIHNFDDQEIQILIKSYLCFVFEIASQQIKNQLVYGTDGVQQLAQKYLSLFELISPQIQLNVYACECLREFFYLLGIYHDVQHFQQSLKYSQIVIKLLCQIDITDQFDLQETFQHMRSILNGQDKKQLIVKNNLQSLLLTRSRLNLDNIKYLELSLSLFPKCDSLYCIAAQIRKNPAFIIKALECNKKCQAALYQLGLLYIGRQNYEFAFQTLQKCIEVEPTTSAFAYLALSIILFIYLQQNYNIEISDCNKVKQLDSLHFYQNQLTQAISSYLDYVSTLQNTPIQNILSIIYRNLYLGYTVKSEAILHDEKFKQMLKQFPSEYMEILYCEIPYIQNSTELEKIYNKYTSIVQIKEEIQLVITQMNQYENINNNQVQWAAKLKYLIHLLTLSIDKVTNLKELVGIINDAFEMLVKNIIKLRQATNIFNFDVLFMGFVNKWYHYTRTIYLKDNSHKDYYLFVAKFQQQCLKLKELNEAQLINYIDQLMDKNNKITQELKHKLQFMELIYQGNWQEAITHLQLCIFHNPLKKVYRDILNKIHLTFYEQKYVQQEILDFRKTNQATLWLNTIINELVLERSRNISRLPLILKIIKFKILPYADNLIAKLLVKVLCDIEQQISTEGLLDQIANKYNINKEKYWIKALIQKKLNEKQNVNQLIIQYRDKYLEQYEDQIQWKKTALLLIPILTQLYFDRGSQGMESILQQIMQNYCLYAQQFLPKDEKLKKARFIYNMLHYGCYIKKLDDIESIGVTLTNLKEIADEFVNQGTFNPTSLSIYIHYHVATEKYQELDKWLEITNQYIYNNDPIIIWGQIIRSYHQVEEKKDINTLKKFVTFVQQQQIQNPKLQSLIHYLIGQAVMNVNDWQQKYSKEEVLKKFQLALLLNPNKEIIKSLQPLQTIRQVKQKLKLRLDQYFEDVQQPKRKLKKKVMEGLNSDSDEALVDQMDYEEDQKEFQQEHGMTLEEHQQITESAFIEQQKVYAEEQVMYLEEQQQYLHSLTQEEQQKLIEFYTQNYDQLSYEQQSQFMLLQGYQIEQIVEYFYHQQQPEQEQQQPEQEQ
ncbi:unnamed protein product [Paramecium primaurelia]|uniref:Tetratricopeptide repeat protein n=1 Tax=Paramecium primaurelia TaxID=5886 RepID=A0A8S1N202_PARPR|nr:unnamed protein product [Paramecium primaurelia]